MSTLILSSQPRPQLTPYFSELLLAQYATPQTVSAQQLYEANVILVIERDIATQLTSLRLLPYKPNQYLFFVVTPEQVEAMAEHLPRVASEQPRFVDYLVAPISPQTLSVRCALLQQRQAHYAEFTTHFPAAAQLPAFISSFSELAWYKDEHLCYQYVNQVFLDFFGKTHEEVIGLTDELIWPENLHYFSHQSDHCVLENHETSIETAFFTGAKSTAFFQVHKTPLFNDAGQFTGIFCFTKNLTSLKTIEQEVQIIFESLPLAACVRDLNGIILHVNQRFNDFYHHAIQVGDNFFSEAIIPLHETRQRIHQSDAEVVRTKRPVTYREAVSFQSQQLTLEITKAPILDLDGNVTRFLLLVSDVSDQVAHEQVIRKLAFEDPLTNLANRSGLYDMLQTDFPDRRFGAIFALDIVNFKRVNERFSYTVGNHLLREIATRLQKLFPEHFVCRDSDEFIIFLTFATQPHSDELNSHAEAILAALELPFEIQGTTYTFTANIGYVGAALEFPEFEDTIHHSELALQVAKQLPTQMIVDYNKGLMAQVRVREELIHDFTLAIEAADIELAYQPQYTQDRQIVGFEALLRWPNNPYPQFSIAEIIAIIEKTPIIHKLGLFVLHKAFAFARLINYRRKTPLTVAINLSAHQVMDANFVAILEELIAEYQISPTMIDLEITETVLLEDLSAAVTKLDYLQQIGFHISLDDFGTGYSSLNYLAKLPLSKVKIDRSFTMELMANSHYQTVVKMIVAASHALNFKVVAEGVETHHELAILKQFNTDYIQGYYFSKPLGESEALKLA